MESIYPRRNWGGEHENVAILVAIAVKEDCFREVLGTAEGMKEAVGEKFPDAKYQRCTVHFYRNVFSVVPKSKVKIVAKVLKTIHTYESKKATCVSVH